ncbi:hypothetical protein BaRGS_00023797 [Batillaria attramentaria]|uniref:Uncharacterized protein n=1 Tax=Batillaria attramentaria TaxID=370345 RepID=A0ABD0KD31_9CAEN
MNSRKVLAFAKRSFWAVEWGETRNSIVQHPVFSQQNRQGCVTVHGKYRFISGGGEGINVPESETASLKTLLGLSRQLNCTPNNIALRPLRVTLSACLI